jgi:hypothetical protein
MISAFSLSFKARENSVSRNSQPTKMKLNTASQHLNSSGRGGGNRSNTKRNAGRGRGIKDELRGDGNHINDSYNNYNNKPMMDDRHKPQ